MAEGRAQQRDAEACEVWLADAREGVVRTRSGHPFKPATLRAYEQSLRLRVYPTLGTVPFYRVRRVHLQDRVDRLVATGTAPATLNTMLGALRAVYGRAVQRDEIEISPTIGVKLPAGCNGRERFATPQEATELLAAVPERDRAVRATAIDSGRRRGRAGGAEVAGRGPDGGDNQRRAGMGRARPDHDEERQAAQRPDRHRAPQVPDRPPAPSAARRRTCPRPDLHAPVPTRPPSGARRCCGGGRGPDPRHLARLPPHLRLDDDRRRRERSSFLGHSSVSITFNRYGHLMPGSEAEAAALLDAYLEATG